MADAKAGEGFEDNYMEGEKKKEKKEKELSKSKQMIRYETEQRGRKNKA
jgi:hypothetical protein